MGATEIALRVLPWPERRAHVMGDAGRHHRLRPGWHGVVQRQPFSVNTLGLREREVDGPPAAGTTRILLLGDSFIEGAGLAATATVSAGLEASLASRCRGIEVLNAGTASYSPILEYLLLKELGPRLAPALVILSFDMTDVHDDFVRTELAELDAGGLPQRVPNDRRRETAILLPPILPRAVRALEARLSALALWQALRRSSPARRLFGDLNLDEPTLVARGLVGDLRYDRLAITRDTAGPDEAAGWAHTARYLRGIAGLAHASGARFVLVAYPHAHQVAAHESPVGRRRFGVGPGVYASDRAFRTLEAIGARQGFPVVTLHHAFRRHADPATPLFRHDDIHHTPAGARLMADATAAALLERALLPGCPA